VANPEHLALLKQGVDVWNAWGAKEKSVRPDLREANLSDADLSGAFLTRANLSHADLSGANLSDADLRGAFLSHADLRGAFLAEANLSDADLSGAFLTEANLSHADLSGATPSGANLSHAARGSSTSDTRRLSIDQMAGAAQACRRARATVMNDGLGDDFQDRQVARAVQMGFRHPRRLSRFSTLPGLGLAVLAAVGWGYALRHEFGALFHWIAGPLFHGQTPPPAAVQPETDVVDVIAFAPSYVGRQESFLVQVFLDRTSEDDNKAEAAAFASDPNTSKRAVATLDVELASGDRIDIKLEAAGLWVEEPEHSLVWRGKARSCAFLVAVPKDFSGDRAVIQARIYRQASPIGRIAFSTPIEVEDRSAQLSPVGEFSRAYHRAFLSYASADRAEVIKRAQALRAANIDFFMDLLSLEPGERWEKRLYSEIDQCDLFVLFWSNAARGSEWVGKEIEYALDCIKKHPAQDVARPEIHPILLEGPPPPKPPDSLDYLHFNDPFLYLIASMEKLAAARPAN
jgi:hypothetical protein